MTQPRILVVEDDPYIARLLECWLQASRYQYVGTAATGQEAIALASSTRPDLVIMDIVLPGDLDGIQTAAILLERFDIPALYLTAFTEDELFERARETAPSAYLTKPFNDRELKRAVEVALDRNALLRSLKASEAHLAEAQAVAHIGSWRWDLLQDHVVASDELLRLFELTPGAFEPRFDSFLQRVSADDQPRIRQAVEALLHGGNPADIDVSIPLMNGQQRILRLRGNVHFDADGQAIELVGTALDITREWMARQETEIYRGQLEKRVVQRTADLDATNRRLQAEIADHLNTEKHLCQSEARYRSLVENLPDAVFVMQDERVVFVNPAAVRLAGVQSPDELLGKTLADLAHPDSQKSIEQRKQAALTSSNPNPRIAYSFLRSDGRAVEVESISFAIEYDGRPAFLGVVNDLTERRRIERSAERFRVALDSSADAIFLIDPTAMSIIDANETACNSLGYTRAELLERGPHDIKPHYNKTTLREHFDQVLAGKPGAEIIQTVHQRKDGSTFPVEVSLRPFESGGQALMVVVARDITQRKQAVQALIESEERYRAVVEDQTDNISRFRTDGTITVVNDAYCRFFGKSANEIIGHTRHPAAFPEDQQEIDAKLGTLTPSNPVVVIENRVVSGSGELHWMQFVNRAFFDDAGRVKEIQSVGRDITDQKKAERALHEAEDFNRAILDAVRTQVAVLDRAGTIIAVNDSWRRFALDNSNVAGQAPARTEIGSNYLDVCLAAEGTSSEGAQDVAQGIRAVMDGSLDIFTYEYPCHAPHQQRWFLMTVTPLGRAQGGVVVAHSDITAPRRLAEELRESEATLERAQTMAQIGSWKLDLETGQLTWSDKTHQIFGTQANTPLTMERFLACVHPDDRERVNRAWSAALAGAPYDVEHRILVGEEVKWVHEQAEIRFDIQGQAVCGYGFVQDINSRKQAELALRKSDARSRSILRAAPVGIGVIVDRVFQEVNEAMTTMTGYQADELLGQSARMLYPTQADFDYVGTEKYRQIGERGIGSVETRWRRKDGEMIDVVLSSSPIVADDLSQGVTFTVLDITASKQAEQARQARETSQRNALVREVHHRIKNNLQGVIGLLRQHMSDHPDTRPAIEAAIAQVNTVAVIHGLQSRRPQQELHLRELLREVSAAAAALAMVAPHPTIEDTLQNDVWLDSSAAVTIALILNELIHNAFKHGLHADGRGVKIALSGDDRLTLIHIRNPGRSLSEDLDLSTGKGCGIGLGLVRTLLPRRGAQLSLYREGGMIHVELVLSAPVIHVSEGAGETPE